MSSSSSSGLTLTERSSSSSSVTVKSLKDISIDVMRRNWDMFKDSITPSSPFYSIIWNHWHQKFRIQKDDKYVKFLRDFINKKEEIACSDKKIVISRVHRNEISIRGLSYDGRREIHEVCDKLGLFHVAKQIGGYDCDDDDDYRHGDYRGYKRKRMSDADWALQVYRPAHWSFENGPRNPYSDLQYEKELDLRLNPDMQLQQTTEAETDSNRLACVACGDCSSSTRLYSSSCDNQIYCKMCLECTPFDKDDRDDDRTFADFVYERVV